MANANLTQAKKNKKDEFYTQLSDIERELSHYNEHFRGKIVLCNCDDPRISNFFHYFAYNFEHLGLKRLITTCYKSLNMDLFSKITTGSIELKDKNGRCPVYIPEGYELRRFGAPNEIFEIVEGCLKPKNGEFFLKDTVTTFYLAKKALKTAM